MLTESNLPAEIWNFTFPEISFAPKFAAMSAKFLVFAQLNREKGMYLMSRAAWPHFFGK